MLLGTVLVLLLFSGAPASAHAALRGTDPDDGSVVQRAPRHLTLTFTESVGLLDDSFRVFGPDQRRVHTGEAQHADGQSDTARVGLPKKLAQGTYTVAWRVVSADSHPVSGAFTFSVGKRSATTAQVDTGPAEDALTGGLYDAARYLAYLAAALLVGTVAFALLCRPADTSPLRRPLVAAWWTLLGSTAVLLMLRAPYETGAGPAAAFDLSALERTLTSRPGLALLARLAVLLLTAAFLLRLFRRRDHQEPLTRAVGAALAVALALTWAAAEHASAGIQVPVAMTSSVLHLVATGVWLGGLVALLLTLRRASVDTLTEVVPRFSRIAFASVTVLAVTGLYQSWRGLGSFAALTGTSYGRLLLAKLVAVTALLLAAGYSRRWTARLAATAATARTAVPERVPQPVGAAAPAQLEAPAESGASGTTGEPGEPGQAGEPEKPAAPEGQREPSGASGPTPDSGEADARRRGLRRSVLVEVAVAAVVLLITTLLTTTLPGRAQAEAAQRSPVGALPPTTLTTVPFDTGTSTGTLSGRGTVEVTLDPARVGENGVQAVVYGADKGLVVVPEVRITFTLPSRKVGPIDARLTDVGGYWSTNSVNLPLAGTWTMKTTVRVSDVDQVTVSKQVRIVP
ncbi:copper resistance protein CopC [Streptomyces coeruleorubidus]|uniref:copper resistance CopC/CopD family protein n=1 Tax=Streptomyces coeruleorubidus TaxID=116188 RepID=UPI00237EFB66|nr:copper resistance protein CopC [Streptomyces coeruleorubidus]WDV56858.1 copper resistance protein CopC [Streptomyces coeruleorubidus]